MTEFEGEYAVRYTKVTGEVIHDTFAVPQRRPARDAWFVAGHADAHATLVRRRPP